MTTLEKEAWEILKEILYYFTNPKVHRYLFTQLMGRIRDTVRHLENAFYGCPSGKHRDYCTCEVNKPGGNRSWSLRVKKNK